MKFTSTVLTIDTVQRDPGVQIRSTGTVNSDAKPGTYDVLAVCRHNRPSGNQFFAGQFTVLDNPTPPAHQVRQVPTGAAQTGGGGTASRS